MEVVTPVRPNVDREVRPWAGLDAFLWPGYLLAVAITSITIGLIWDISWHTTIGRDTFWTPAHMAIYLGGSMGGFVGGWLAIKYTFLLGPEREGVSVSIFGARAPLGAWVAIWGAIAMITSGPFDDWWHNAYGLDVKIVSPPHAVLGLGMFGISIGALLLVLSRQNQRQDKSGSGLFVYVGGVFLVLAAVFITETTLPNHQHGSLFYLACSLVFPMRLVAMSRAGKCSWPATRVALVYMLVQCLMMWILPLFPAQPMLAPIYNPVTHMVPPAFPLLLIFPAIVIDLVLGKVRSRGGWLKTLALALGLGGLFLVILLGVQWYFAEFLLSPSADNWFFGGNRYWTYGSRPGPYRQEFWRLNKLNPNSEYLRFSGLLLCWGVASLSAWIGLIWGDWMRKVRR